MPARRVSRRSVFAVLFLTLAVAGCGREGVSAGFLAGDAETECIWGQEATGDRYEIALPPGWTASFAPVAIVDDGGDVFVREGENLSGAEGLFPWERSGPVVCEVDGAVGTVRFVELEVPTTSIDDEVRR